MNKILMTLLLACFAITSQAAVEKRYVSDKLWLQVRSGPGNDFRILKAVASGTHLVYMEETEDKSYTKVKLESGIEGWVLSRFLEDEPVAKEKLILANRELDKVKAELKTLQQKNSALSSEKSNLSSDRSGLSREKKKLEKELKRIKEVSANAIQLDEKNTRLTKRNQELEIQVEALTADNARMSDNKERTFMIIGGGLIVIGIILGLVIPSMRGGRSSGGGWA